MAGELLLNPDGDRILNPEGEQRLGDDGDPCCCAHSYDCVDGECVGRDDDGGEYATEEECDADCMTTYDCTGFACVPVDGPGGEHATLEECEAVCGFWDCVDGNCEHNEVSGEFASLVECQAVCFTYWECVDNEDCLPLDGEVGPYALEEHCLSVCGIDACDAENACDAAELEDTISLLNGTFGGAYAAAGVDVILVDGVATMPDGFGFNWSVECTPLTDPPDPTNCKWIVGFVFDGEISFSFWEKVGPGFLGVYTRISGYTYSDDFPFTITIE